MRPLTTLTADQARQLRGLVFDLDGTVLTDGALTREAYEAVHLLKDAGLSAVVCTGRPAAWGEVVQRQWPVDLTVTENGAVAYRSDGPAVERLDRCSSEERGRRRAQLLTVLEHIRRAFPEVALADDNLGRLSDVTFDIGERHRVSADQQEEIRSLARSLGARTFSSSIHLHVTMDADDKMSGTLHALHQTFDEDRTAALGRWGFIGDSKNDEACFAGFRHSFGVANVKAHLPSMTVGPRWVSQGEQSAGFSEIVRRILDLRG
jgi:HAD superfamily hydrolase (TIGR01484 family)